MQTHRLKIRSTDDSSLDGTRLSESHQGETKDGEIAKRIQRFHARLQILDFRNRKGGVAAIRALPDVDKPTFVTVDEREQQHATNQAEHRGIGTDSQSQSQNDRHRKTLCTA